ncbi:MAG: hypothetical protein JXM69_04350 [Anaerolineae bacterium]|nr:hypothetical protein [Anaerolineae bacterium]
MPGSQNKRKTNRIERCPLKIGRAGLNSYLNRTRLVGVEGQADGNFGRGVGGSGWEIGWIERVSRGTGLGDKCRPASM